MVSEINENEFDAKMKGKCLVDFYTTWCGPCKMLAPVVSEVSEEVEGVSFYKVDVDSNPNLGSKHRIMSVPTLVLFEDGNAVSRASGYMGKEQLKKFING